VNPSVRLEISNVGLDYADQRYYASTYGRFNSPDPYVASGGPSDPGSWNRYSYTRGDPVNRADPRGLEDCTVADPGDDPGTGAGGAGGGGVTQRTGPLPADPPATKNWQKAMTTLSAGTRLIAQLVGGRIAERPECESDFAGIQKTTGLTLPRIADAAGSADLEDGTTSTLSTGGSGLRSRARPLSCTGFASVEFAKRLAPAALNSIHRTS
jgi:RHS repeat-associated protein